MEYEFNQLENAPLVVDAIYKSGTTKNISSEVLHHLFPKCGTSGGFRKVNRADGSGKLAYVVLYTSMEELEWPDYLDVETGIFRYYGDNRKPGNELLKTKLKGNHLLEEVFNILNSKGPYDDIPPFFIFKKTGRGRDVQFLGLAAPGNPKISPDKDLISFWRTMNDKRFQNYEAYFTVLDTKEKVITKKWLECLIHNNANSLDFAPDCWKKFVKTGRNGIKALSAKRILKIPSKYEQLQSDQEGQYLLQRIRDYYSDNPYGFEVCAIDLISKLNVNFQDFSLSRPWRDGGIDASGYYVINSGGTQNHPLKIDCALEAKCYSEKNSVGVKAMSRLISRIRYRQFGILITTSYVDSQAYKEVVEDGHPILIVTANDIAAILRNSKIDRSNVDAWLESLVDTRY